MANATVATQQKTFANTMNTLLTELKGGKLAEFCEADRSVVGTDHTFYRINSSDTSDSINYYDAGYTGSAGDTANVVCTPAAKYAHGFLKAEQILKTNLDLKGSYAKSFKRAIDRAEDKVIIAAIAAQDSKLTKKGTATAEIGAAAQFDKLVEAVGYAQALVKENGDHGDNVAIVINPKDYGNLFVSTKFASSDFTSISDTGTRLAGGLFVISDAVASGTTYIMPRMLCTFAAWKGSEKSVMEFDSGKDGFRVWAKKSMGAKLGDLDAPSVIKFSSKPIV